MSCNHDWFDHYMMYSAMSGRNKGGRGSGDFDVLCVIIAIGGAIYIILNLLAGTF